MKVLSVSPSYWPAFQYGGPIFVNHYLNRALAKRGLEVTVYTSDVGLDPAHTGNRQSVLDGVKVHYFPIIKWWERLGTTGWQLSRQLAVALLRNVRTFDIVHIHAVWNFPVAMAALACRLHGVPYVLTVHGVLYPYTLSSKRWKKRLYFYAIARWILRGAKVIHYTGADEQNQCHLRLGLTNRSAVVPYVLDLAEFQNQPPREELVARYPVLKHRKTILFVSRLNPKKGLDLLTKAFAQVVQRYPNCHLLIVGNDEGGYVAEVCAQLLHLGLTWNDSDSTDVDPSASVTFTGFLAGPDKVQAYAGSDLFVLPSYSENFGVVVVEAMACGLPVIISNQVGICDEVERERAGIVVPTDASKLADAMLGVLQQPEEAMQMGKRGKEAVIRLFAPEAALDGMIQLYRSIALSST